MKPRFHSCLSTITIATTALFSASSTVRATDYSFGTSTQGFTLTATDQARALGWSLGVFEENGSGAVYWRSESNTSDATFAHFDLSSFAGATVIGDVNLNFTVDAWIGGDISAGQVSTANSAWTYSYGGSAPGFTAIGGSTGPNATFANGDTATWTIPETIFQGFVDTPSSFYGLVVTAGSGSTAHFSGSPTITGTLSSDVIRVTGATDWSAASWDNGTSTLSVSGSNTVTGGDVLIRSAGTLSVTGSATLGAGSFAGAIQNFGTLSFGSSASQALSGTIQNTGTIQNSGALSFTGSDQAIGGTIQNSGTLSFNSSASQTLSAAVSGAGSLDKSGSGTLTLTQAPGFSGDINVSGGQLVIDAEGSYSPAEFHISNGTLEIPGSGYRGVEMSNPISIAFDAAGGGVFKLGGGVNFYSFNNTSYQITSAGGAQNRIEGGYAPFSSGLNLNTMNANIDVVRGTDPTSDLKVLSGFWNNGSLTKTGDGILELVGANAYTGSTTVSEGTLVMRNTCESSGFDIASGAELELSVDSGTRDYGTATTFSGTGTLRKTGDGTAIWGSSVATIALGAGAQIDVQGGSLNIGSYANDSMSGNLADLNVAAGATFNSAACDAYVNALTGAGTVILAYNNDYPRTMTVGVNDGGGTFSGALTDGPDGGNGNLVKTGTGTQILSGTNSYTGNTTVDGGTLVLADDAQLKFVVTDTNQNSVTGTGTVTFHGDFSIDTSAVSGTTGHIWQLVDLANLDPASSFTSSFSVIGFSDPENDGIWTMTDAKGDWSFDESTGELTLVTADNDYDTWGSAYGLSTGSEGDDLDNDGLTNGEEYAFGLIPDSGSSVNPILAPLTKTTGQFTYQRRDNGLTGLTYTIWYSTDLATWNEDTGATQPDGTPDGNGVETITVTLSPALLTNPKLFIQVRAN